MVTEQLPENLAPDDYARALLRSLESGAKLDPALRQQLSDAVAIEAPDHKVPDDVATVSLGAKKALESVAGKVSIDTLEARNDDEALVLRGLKILKRCLTRQANDEDKLIKPGEFDKDFDMKQPKLRRAMIDLLKDFGVTLDIDDVGYFFWLLSRGESEPTIRSSYACGMPKGFSEGDLLEIRRTFIQRYLDEIPEDEDDPYNSPRLWYGYLIRPDVFCYERGEDVRFIVSEAIRREAEAVRPDRAAYIRGILKATLDNLNGEKDVVARLKQLYEQYPSPDYTFEFVDKRGPDYKIVAGEIIIKKSDGDKKVVKTVRPEKPMIAQDFNVIR